MSFESEFRIKEKEFRPRDSFSHDHVVESLANIVKEADNRIIELEDENNRKISELRTSYFLFFIQTMITFSAIYLI